MLGAARRGGSVAQKRLFLYCCRPIRDCLMWMQIPAKVAPPCDVVSVRVLREPLAQPQLKKKKATAEYTDVSL